MARILPMTTLFYGIPCRRFAILAFRMDADRLDYIAGNQLGEKPQVRLQKNTDHIQEVLGRCHTQTGVCCCRRSRQFECVS